MDALLPARVSNEKIMRIMWVGLAVLAATYVLVSLAPIPKLVKVTVLNALYLLPPLAAVISGAAAFTGSKNSDRAFWLYLSLAICSLLIGELVWGYYEVVARIAPPQPSAADVFYLGAYLFYGLALVSMARSSGRLTVTKARYLLDLLMMLMISIAVLWVFLLRPLYAEYPNISVSQKVVNSTYPIVDLIIVFGLAVNIVGLKSGKRRPWEALIAAGVIAYFMGDVIYNFFSALEIYDAHSFWAKLLDVTWMTAYWLFFMAAVYQLTHQDLWQPRAIETGTSRPASKWSRIGVPAALVIAVPWLIYEAVYSGSVLESVALTVAAVLLPIFLLQRSATVFYLRQTYMYVLTDVSGGRLVMMTNPEIEAALGEPVSREIALHTFADLAPARRRIETTIEDSFLGFDRGWDLTVAAGEAMSNALKHASSARYRICRAPDRIQIVVIDNGPGIDFTLLPRAVLVSGFSTVDSFGKGFSFMLGLCDRVLLSTEPGRTTVVLEMVLR